MQSNPDFYSSVGHREKYCKTEFYCQIKVCSKVDVNSRAVTPDSLMHPEIQSYTKNQDRQEDFGKQRALLSVETKREKSVLLCMS